MFLSLTIVPVCDSSSFFFFNDTATTEIYTLSLHDALPICCPTAPSGRASRLPASPEHNSGPATTTASPFRRRRVRTRTGRDRKSTRLNSSHGYISYAVFCLKKKKKKKPRPSPTYGPPNTRV